MSKKGEKKPPFWIVLLAFISVFGGIFASIIGISKIENYSQPYLFALIFGGLGIILGVIIALKLKPIIAVNPRMKSNYTIPILFFSIGFFGLLLMSGAYANEGLSEVEYCEKFEVVNKYRQEYRYARPEVNSLVVNIDGISQRLVCSYDYWKKVYIGQDIDLCLNKSKIGFDYISIKK